jgi:NADH:ubiquinone oxidoreductase subunit K
MGFAYFQEKRNFLNLMLYCEAFYFSLAMTFMFNINNNSRFVNETFALIFVIVAAAESAIGLSFLIFIKKSSIKTISLEFNNALRG